jgi:hypothetical protein
MIEPIKCHPGCDICQCYPEGRNDCPDHMKCRARLGYTEPPTGVCEVHGPYGDERCFICIPHEHRPPLPEPKSWWQFWK